MPKDIDRIVKQAWELYFSSREVDSTIVPFYVATSWRRCCKIGVNPHKYEEVELSSAELDRRLKNLENVVSVALKVMQNFYDYIKEPDFLLVLADSQGSILKVLNPNDVFQGSRSVHFYAGADWSESAKGTNAIGTCLVEKKPLQIHGSQHFCEANHILTCSAAPICDTQGNLIAVLNMSMLTEARHACAKNLGMVVVMAKSIENRFRLKRANERLFEADKYTDAIVNTMSDGLLTIDQPGIVRKINNTTKENLRANSHSCVGVPASKVLKDATPPTGGTYQNKEIMLENDGRTFKSSGCLPHDDFGHPKGAAAVIKRQAIGVLCNKKMSSSKSVRYTIDDIVGTSDVMVETRMRAEIASKSASTVLIYGESGTGKEVFAQSIHAHSDRLNKPFIPLNCASIPETLIESELFGYEEGAFTGARKGGYVGKIELAGGGSLFLDEIGDMPLPAQVKLLRVIQERKLLRLGATTEVPVDIRIIAATHKDLKQEMVAARFRKDLYYRLNVLTIRIPPLRGRPQDLPQLVEYFVAKISLQLGKPNLRISDSFMRDCCLYPWPGNVRELENVIERAVNMVDESNILTPDLMELEKIHNHEMAHSTMAIPSMKEMERDLIIRALKHYSANIVQVSNALGISRGSIYRKIREYDIEYTATNPVVIVN